MPEILSIGELLDLGNSASTAGLIPYSALEYNGSGDISGISGSAIAGGVDTTVVSSIASSYVESGISGKVDQSAFDDCCSAMSSVVSSKLDASASSLFALSSDVSSTVDVVANKSAIWGQGGGNYSGITPIVVDNTARTVGISSMQLDVDDTMTSYLSGGVTYFGVNESVVNTLRALSAWATANGWTGA